MKTFLMTFVVWLAAITGATAQTTNFHISGEILNSTNEPLPGATIRLTHNKQGSLIQGTTTDAQGLFTLAAPRGTYQLEISYIGYTTYTTHVEVKGNIRLPFITLNEDAQLMNEVVVTARTITYNHNGYVAEISKNAFYKNKDMTNILRLTPGTNITGRGIEAYGGNISKVYLNNRELKLHGDQLIDYLQTIEGKNVKEMEVIIASGVEDDAASAGQAILKITTINPETGGMLGIGGSAGVRMNTLLYGGNMNMQWRINKHWGMYMNASSMNTESTDGTRSKTRFYDTSEQRINELENEIERSNHRGTLGLTYDMDANNLFSFEGNYTFTPSNNDQWDETRHWDNNQYHTVAKGTADGNRELNNMNLSFLYLHKFNKNSELTFKAESFNSQVDENEEQQYQYTASNQAHNRLNKEDNRLYTLKADYTHKLPSVNGKLSAGVKAHWLTNDNYTDYASFIDGQQNPTGSYDDKYKYSENIYALYAKYSFTWKKFGFNAGLRMEHSTLSPESATNPERNEENDYTDFFPEIGVSYTLNKEKGHNTSLTYNKTIRRPSIGALNPLVRRINEYNYSMGNPSLKPYYTHSLSWTTHLFHKYILRAYYDYADNGIIGIGESKDGIIYSTSHNGSKNSHFRVYASVPVQISKKARLSFSGGYYYSNVSYKEDKRNYSDWSMGCTGMFTLPANIDVMIDFHYSPPSKSLYGKTYNRPYANLHINKSFLKGKLTTTLMFGDLFDQLGSRRSVYHYDTYWQETEGSKKNYGGVLSIRYNLRWGQKSNVRRAGSSSDSGRFATE